MFVTPSTSTVILEGNKSIFRQEFYFMACNSKVPARTLFDLNDGEKWLF